MSLSPGAHFLLTALLPKLLITPLTITGIRVVVLGLGYDYLVPSLIRSKAGVVIASVALVILLAILKEKWTSYSHTREAHRLGAVEFPKVRGKLPGNIDILWSVVTSWENEYLGHSFAYFMAQHGNSINMRFMWGDLVWTSNPSLIKTILATDFGNYVKGRGYQKSMNSMLGTGVFNADGDMWKFHRSMTRPFFSRDRISDFDIFDRHAKEAIAQMKERFSRNAPLDFQELISHFTLDSSTEFLFGKSVRSLAAPLTLPGQTGTPSTINQFSKSFAAVQSAISFRIRVGRIWQLCEIFGDSTKKDMEVIYSFIDPILNDALAKEKIRKEAMVEKEKGDEASLNQSDTHPEEIQTLLGHLVSMSDDKTVIRDELLNILMAGRDTTTAALTFITYFLATHPEVLGRLRQEILDVVGKDDRPSFEQVREMKYLGAVIHESLRLLPPVPFNFKKSVKRSTWTDPKTGVKYYIPKNTSIPWSVILLQRDKELWGPDADLFDPDRWLDQRNKTYYLANPFIFIPFSAGPRICLGQQFALNEMSFFLVRLLQNFDHVELAFDAQPSWSRPPASWKSGTGRKAFEEICPLAHITSYSKGGLWVRMRAAGLQASV